MNATATTMTPEFWRDFTAITESKELTARLVRYVRRLTHPKPDPTLMTREEFFARLDRAEQGPSVAMLPGEDLTHFLRRQGYDI